MDRSSGTAVSIATSADRLPRVVVVVRHTHRSVKKKPMNRPSQLVRRLDTRNRQRPNTGTTSASQAERMRDQQPFVWSEAIECDGGATPPLQTHTASRSI